MIIHIVTLKKECKIIAEEIVVFEENKFSFSYPEYAKIKPAMIEAGWNVICNHTFEKNGFEILFRTMEVKKVVAKDILTNHDTNVLVNTLMYYDIAMHRVARILSKDIE
jgi:hypothetical protein